MKKRNQSSKRIYDILVFGVVVFSLVFINATVSSDLTDTETNQMKILGDDPHINIKELLKNVGPDDVCDDCDDDDDDNPGVNKKPTAHIYQIEPNPAYEHSAVTFEGYGEDPDGDITEYWWESDINDILSYEALFTSNILSAGTHTIYFYVRDNDNAWSNPDEIALEILENQGPNAPVVAGSASGKPGVEQIYKFITTDPEGHKLYFYVEWGDGKIEDWTGPYSSNEEAEISHIWEQQGSYTIRAKSKDIYDVEGDWGTMEIQMPKAKLMKNTFLYNLISRLFSRLPIIFDL